MATTSSTPGEASSTRSGEAEAKDPARVEQRTALMTEQGRTTISDVVVQKIAALATREVNGVYDLGAGAARTFGAIRERIPGARASTGQGVAVEVGERQTAVDLDIVVEYGVAVGELSKAVRRNVITSIERMTSLEVVEVNIAIDDIHLPGDDEAGGGGEARVE
jgi:uncharacterized alkaline shock family protein YloU